MYFIFYFHIQDILIYILIWFIDRLERRFIIKS